MFLFGLACGVSLSVAWVYLVRAMHRKPPPPISPTVTAVETYGHAFDLVEEFRSHLPSPPEGHMWESGVKYTSDDPELWIGLLDYRTENVVASTSRNLRRRGPGLMFTWADDYADFGTVHTTSKARREIVLPLLNWAAAQANQHGEGGIERYDIQG
jgi:hypothetical protein